MLSSIEPALLVDLGSLYVRFAIERLPGVFSESRTLQCADYPDFASALKDYLSTLDASEVRHAAIATPGPIAGDLVRMVNYPWQFSVEETRQATGLETLVAVNDFTALAMGIPSLQPEQFRKIGRGEPQAREVIGLVGPGTGLGVSGLIPEDHGWVSLGSEGGHADFSPQSETEIYLLQYAWKRYPHVSAERLLSAAGIEMIYQALCERVGYSGAALPAPEISRRAVQGNDPISTESLNVFCEVLGSVAANLALTLGAFGGIYIGGGIVPRLGEYFDRSGFRARFEAKGRYQNYVAQIPTFLITAESATLLGTANILRAQLRHRAGASTLLDRVRRAHASLSAAKRRVAEVVLTQPRSVLNDPIVEIARLAKVSQPTVVRFCRSVGCEGLSDFKLKLASGLTGTIPLTHTKVARDDPIRELSTKVIDNTVSAVLRVRDQLNGEAVERAIGRLLKAQRIEFYGFGNYAVVAQDAHYKFLRFGVPTAAYSDGRMAAMAASALGKSDLVVAITGSGKPADLLEAVDIALSRGAEVISLAPSHSPLAKRSSVSIAIDHPEDVEIHIPMISRILYLVVVDILAVGVAMRGVPVMADNGDASASSATKDDTRRKDYTRLISHSG